MSQELVKISPENLEIARSYITLGNIPAVCSHLCVDEETVVNALRTREVKSFIDTVYFDMGYRNRNNIASLLDEIVESKLEEARESGMYTSKDLLDVLSLIHKMKMDEIKMLNESEKVMQTSIRHQTNVQINGNSTPLGGANLGNLVKELLNAESGKP